ncbi:MAG: aquaporin Z [Acidimicrobiales bacterium]
MNERTRIIAAEAFGTGFLVLGGCGTAVLAGSKVGFGGVAAAFGLSLLVMAYAIGPISGCHINPAVTIGLAAAKKTRWADTPYYIAGQLVGGAIGALVLFIIANGVDGFSAEATGFASNGYAEHSPGGYNLASVAVTEIVMTAFLLFTVVSTLHRKFSVGFGGLAAGLVLALIHLISIPVDNTSVNPARSLAVAIFQGDWALTQLWAFIVFPIIGGVVGAILFRVLAGADADIPLAETTAQ